MVFWEYPFYTDIFLPNDVSQARDLDASERNFQSAIKGSLSLALAGGSLLLFKGSGVTAWEWGLSMSLIMIAALLPIVSLINYGHDLDGFNDQVGDVHADWPFMAVMFATCVIVVIVNVHEYSLL